MKKYLYSLIHKLGYKIENKKKIKQEQRDSINKFNVEENFAGYGLEPGQWYGLAVERSGYWGVHRDTAEVFPVAKREIVSTEWVRI